MATPATCKPMKATSNGAFQGDNPLDFAVPLAILQIVLVLVVTRSLAFLLKPLRQPRVIAEVIGGILLGPSAIGKNKKFLNTVFPARSLTVLDTLANIGLIFFLFLVGLELDLQSLKKTGKRALAIALAGISIPFALGIGASIVLRATIAKGGNASAFLVFMGVALSITAFPVLARILAELKLLTTDVGRMSMSAAAVNDVAAWILLALAIALSGDATHSHIVPLWVLLCGVGFVGLAVLVARPALAWIGRRGSDGESVGEVYICVTLAIVLAAAFLTDAIGIHALFGAFIIGVIMPKEGGFSQAMVEKVEDLVSGLFLPLYFVSSGLKTDVATIRGAQSWGLLALVIFTACFGKIMGTVGVSVLCKIPVREAVVLGFLMNTKGLVELIVLNIGKDRKVLNDQTFAIMVLMALFTTFITTPVVIALYKPARLSKRPYKDRTIETSDSSEAELRLMVCFHSTRNIPTVINLIEAARGADRPTGLLVYALHLMELSERSSAILMVHKARRNGLPFWDKRRWSDADHFVVAFEAFQQLSKVSVRPMTAISSFSDIHKDICVSAERKRAAMLIVPFHKHQRLDGAFETTRAEFRLVNRKVLEEARCSVGILVDRGLGGQTHISASSLSSSIAVLFFGGADDREALALGLRMSEHPGVNLTVVRFKWEPNHGSDSNIVVAVDNNESSQRENEAALAHEVKSKGEEEGPVVYEEKVVRNKIEIVAEVQKVSRCNLVLVGRRPEGLRPQSLMERSDSPELGPFGSLLASNEFAATASVLVVQKFTGEAAVVGVDGDDFSD